MTMKLYLILFFTLLVAITASLAFGGVAKSHASAVEWPLHGLDAKEQRFSALAHINEHNVDQLGLAWSFDTDFNRGLEATPIVVDGVMYVTGNWSVVYALNAKSGQLIWKYDPQVPKAWGGQGCCDVVNRGVAVADGKVVVGTFDARLIALDASTGELIWETLTADTANWSYTITGAPRIAKGKVFIGNGGAEYGVRGYISAYDLNSGELAWRFYTVPGNPANGYQTQAEALAAATWTAEWWRFGGGGTVWDSIVYDEELDQLYFGTGNGSPWNRELRSPDGGDNLYLSSVVAVNPDTGEYIWHYQETPAENWDFTSTQPLMLANMQWQGQTRKVIWHAPKNGFFFVIDRITGVPISIEPYTTQNWASHYDKETWRPIETQGANYQKNPGLIQSPASMGAHNWNPMAYSPNTGLVYIPVSKTSSIYAAQNAMDFTQGSWNLGVDLEVPPIFEMPSLTRKVINKLATGYLLAWDPISQAEAWRKERKNGGNGGTLATAGNLVFQGTSSGEMTALRADTGKTLWSYDTQVGIIAAPITYTIDNEQYLAVAAGWGGSMGLLVRFDQREVIPPSRILVFKLGAQQWLPALVEHNELTAIPPMPKVNGDIIAKGAQLYANNCFVCHGMAAHSAKAIPDLRNLPMPFYDNFDAIVRGGMMLNAGMPSFENKLNETEVDAIYAYVLAEAHALRHEAEPSFFDGPIDFIYDIFASAIVWFMS